MAKRKRAMALGQRGLIGDVLRVPPGPVDLRGIDTRGTPGFRGAKADAGKVRPKLAERLSTLQEQLYAEGRAGGGRRVLLVLQGMDTSGKGGTIRHVVGQMDPAGVRVTAFRTPTEEERSHDFLWRIRARLPDPGHLGVFDRSHYEDVVVARVRGLVDRDTWMSRYDAINRFEEELVAGGTRVVKCFLHISAQEQKERLLKRLDDPTKQWKFNPSDLEDRTRWEDHMEAYGDAIQSCDTEIAPWHIVPADRKWYRNWAITLLLIEALDGLELAWPPASFDVEEQRRRLMATP
jgi:PPK2 family polyphosphate:nucleotide phosphotransferase